MKRVRSVPFAVLLRLDPLTVVLTILGCDVVSPLALLASESHLYALFILRHL